MSDYFGNFSRLQPAVVGFARLPNIFQPPGCQAVPLQGQRRQRPPKLGHLIPRPRRLHGDQLRCRRQVRACAGKSPLCCDVL